MKDTAPQRATILVVDPDGDRRARILRVTWGRRRNASRPRPARRR
jgi:hypothetical protein